MTKIINARLGRNGDEPVISDLHAAREAVRAQQAKLLDFGLTRAEEGATFLVFEAGLLPQVMALARTVVVLFLVASSRRYAQHRGP